VYIYFLLSKFIYIINHNFQIITINHNHLCVIYTCLIVGDVLIV